MIIYQTEKSGFLHDLHTRDIEEVIGASFRAKTGRKVGQAEIKSWANSLEYMGKVLMDTEIPGDCGVAIEYTIPQTAKRVSLREVGVSHEGGNPVREFFFTPRNPGPQEIDFFLAKVHNPMQTSKTFKVIANVKVPETVTA